MQQIYRRTPMPKCDFNKVVRATSKTWTQTLDPDPGPGPWKTLDPEKLGLRKTWTLEKLDPEKPGLWKTWTIKNAGDSWMQKKKLEDHMVKFINIEITLRHCFSPVNLLHIFRTRFLKNTSGWLLLNNVSDICSSHVSHVIHSKLSRFAYFQENGNSVSRKYSNCFE